MGEWWEGARLARAKWEVNVPIKNPKLNRECCRWLVDGSCRTKPNLNSAGPNSSLAKEPEELQKVLLTRGPP